MLHFKKKLILKKSIWKKKRHCFNGEQQKVMENERYCYISEGRWDVKYLEKCGNQCLA